MSRSLTARARRRDDGKIVLSATEVGLWREVPPVGTLVRPGVPIGRIEQLGRITVLCAPAEAAGIVVEQGGEQGRARRPVGYGDVILVLDPEAVMTDALAPAAGPSAAASGLVFAAPSSGRFYRRPAPDKPPFVKEGDVIDKGHTVAIVEVMKTFNRIHYEGGGLPDRARVVRILPADGDDLGPGDPILEIEPADN